MPRMIKREEKPLNFEIKDIMLEDKGWRGIFRFTIGNNLYGLLFIKNDNSHSAISVYHIGKNCPFCEKEGHVKEDGSKECEVLDKHGKFLLNRLINMPTIRLRWLLKEKQR